MELPKIYRGEPYDSRIYRVVRQKDQIWQDKYYIDFLVSHEFIAAQYARRLGEEKAYSAELEEENKNLKNQVCGLREENRRLKEGVKKDQEVLRLKKNLEEVKIHLASLQKYIREHLQIKPDAGPEL